MARTCRKHNIRGIATYGDCPKCIAEMAAVPAAGSAIDQRLDSALAGQNKIAAIANKMEAERDEARLIALGAQRNALAEARLRIIARCEQVEGWSRQDTTDMIRSNWDGIAEGLQQARRIIGAMWDELPVPKPQAVIEHEAKCAAVMNELNNQAEPANQQ